jgi:hypothetical protein
MAINKFEITYYVIAGADTDFYTFDSAEAFTTAVAQDAEIFKAFIAETGELVFVEKFDDFDDNKGDFWITYEDDDRERVEISLSYQRVVVRLYASHITELIRIY